MRIVSYNVRYFGHALKGLASTAGDVEEVRTTEPHQRDGRTVGSEDLRAVKLGGEQAVSDGEGGNRARSCGGVAGAWMKPRSVRVRRQLELGRRLGQRDKTG
jgi:hypothetical protein